MTSWGHDDDESPELAVDRARAALAARWFLRNGAPSPEHHRAVMAALTEAESVDPFDQAKPPAKPQ